MVTAETIYTEAVIDPTDFGIEIVPASVTDPEDQKALALAHIEARILPGAESEVSVPLLRVSRGTSLPLPSALILGRYPTLDDDQIDTLNDRLQDLYDEAVTAYARAEIYNQTASNQASYDADVEKDRKIGDARLAKLLDAVSEITNTGPDLPGSDIFGKTPGSSQATNVASF